MVKDAVEFLAFTMKKREKGPVGGLLLDHLECQAPGLYRHIIERHASLKLAEESLTNDIDSQFLGGFIFNTNASLNCFMADYDIIRVLKNHVGYKCWDDVPGLEKEYCYKNYTSKKIFPCGIHSKKIIEQNIHHQNILSFLFGVTKVDSKKNTSHLLSKIFII